MKKMARKTYVIITYIQNTTLQIHPSVDELALWKGREGEGEGERERERQRQHGRVNFD